MMSHPPADYQRHVDVDHQAAGACPQAAGLALDSGEFVPAAQLAAPAPAVDITVLAHQLVRAAQRAGLVITIEQRPLQPLAMGHHETVVSVRPARGVRVA